MTTEYDTTKPLTPTEARRLIAKARHYWGLEPGEAYPEGEAAIILALAKTLEAFLPTDETETVEEAARRWNRNYYGSVDTTALLLAFKAGARWSVTREAQEPKS